MRGARTTAVDLEFVAFPSLNLIPMGTPLASFSLTFGPVRCCQCRWQARQDNCSVPPFLDAVLAFLKAKNTILEMVVSLCGRKRRVVCTPCSGTEDGNPRNTLLDQSSYES